VQQLRVQVSIKAAFGVIVGRSTRMRQVYETVKQVAPTLATVLVMGESGTGKELVARALHNRSPRQKGPFVTLNCGALPETLVESELFGYERGAFTGATGTKAGRVEQAHGGTLFLDEVGEMSPKTQVDLLRALPHPCAAPLAEVEVRREELARRRRRLASSGGTKAAPRGSLPACQVPSPCPPFATGPRTFRSSPRCFFESSAPSTVSQSFSAAVLQIFREYTWPGNVRELRIWWSGWSSPWRPASSAPFTYHLRS
jgi:DNA-binding NtrC family response regulator